MRSLLYGASTVLRFAYRVDRRRMLIASALLFMNDLSGPVVALALASVVDHAIARDAGAATAAAAVVAFVWLARQASEHYMLVVFLELGDRASIAFDERLLQLTNAPPRIDHLERPEYADRIALLREDVSSVWWTLPLVVDGFALVAQLIFSAVLLARVDPVLAVLPLAAAAPLHAGRVAERVLDSAKMQNAESDRLERHLIRLAVEPGAAKEARLFELRDELRARHRRIWKETASVSSRAHRRAALITTLGQIVFSLVYVAALLLTLERASHGHASAGDVLLAFVLVGQINQQVRHVLRALTTLARTALMVARYDWLVRLAEAGPPPTPRAPVPPRLRHGIAIRDVSFVYPGRDVPALSGISLALPAASTVAIIGENGSGKTTLVKLLCGFYVPSSGTIEVDGTDLDAFAPTEWRRRVSGIFQDFATLEARAQETVGVGHLPDADDRAAVLAALSAADAREIVDRLPAGLATQLGATYAQGVEPSHGEWQRLALARGRMRPEPLLLVFDEPASALDAVTERSLFSRYTESMHIAAGRSGGISVLTSHRFSTVALADLIVVLAHGRVVEVGTHDELVRGEGLYAELYSLQRAAYT